EVNNRPIFSVADLASAIEQFKPEEILLAMPRSSKAERRQIIKDLEHYHLPIKTMPSWEDLSSGKMKLQDVQDVDIGDVLGRPEVPANEALLAQCITGKAVLVTGAGGSIGSEIARQVLKNAPQRLVVLDHSEFNLYAIDRELTIAIELQGLEVELVSILASVTDQQRLLDVMQHYQVQTVYHAAAYKHVPIVEHNISQGIINNVMGTLAAAQAACMAKVEHFVLISTDKAVRPTNVMGASKRLAEMVLQAMSDQPRLALYGAADVDVENHTNFTMVRFGNVLGSSGSVIPVFKEQIRLGGPITVTHEDINRYFMSIPEAAQLVIQAGAMGQGGDVFVLDMGEPVRIVDLAKRMVTLSGLSLKTATEPEGDIEIIVSGLRPGEKLYEELLIGDNPEATEHERICKASEDKLAWAELLPLLAQFEALISAHDYEAIRALLGVCVSGFEPDANLVDWLSGVGLAPAS
ncbi:MAG: polysaccharide biosynthesis protein, partial [Gammaproteobacteria bacterium]|nr:polysaccharide biosynthesis protein [Gammaproteobacteria bacterium]